MSSDILESLSTNPHKHHFFTEKCTEIVYSKIIKNGDKVIDLGANHGHHTRILSRLVGSVGRVHAFEPNPDLLSELVLIAENVRLWPFAAGEGIRQVDLFIPEGLDGWASLNDIRSELPDRKFGIKSTMQVSIDELIEVTSSQVSFVKIDVERREVNAIFGMRNLLIKDRPLVICEGNTEENFAVLKLCGYNCYNFSGSTARQNDVLANFIALPFADKDKIQQIIPTQNELTQLEIEFSHL